MACLKQMMAATVAAAALLSSPAWAAGSGHNFFAQKGNFIYEVTLTNITKGQVFSPPVLVTHSRDIALFELGEPALEELATVAEDGDGGPLVDLIGLLPEVFDAQTTSVPILPGETAVYEVSAPARGAVLSVVAMLVNSNDAFLAADSAALPRARHRSRSLHALAYDAGSEANNEDCAFVPGPACPAGSGNARATEDAEGYVHIHNGIHGIAELMPEAYDWKNPVASIQVKRIR